jgi:hypothetical protein
MTPDELHQMLDRLLAGYLIAHPGALPSETSVAELLVWSFEQTGRAPAGMSADVARTLVESKTAEPGEATRQHLAEAIAILANAVGALGDPSIVAHRGVMLPALDQAGRAFVWLGEAEPGEDLRSVCVRVIARHNARIPAERPDPS